MNKFDKKVFWHAKLDKNLRFFLSRFFFIDMFSKFVVEENSPAELENIALTYMAYKKIVDYCEKNPEAKEKVASYPSVLCIFISIYLSIYYLFLSTWHY